MYQIDQSLHTALAGGACGLRLRCDGVDYEVLSAKLTSTCCAGQLTIGAVTAAELTARLWGACPPSGATVTLEARLEQTYLPLGTFRVSESTLSDDIGELTACDAAWYAMQEPYVPGAQPPATALTLLADVAQQCGLTLGSVTDLTDQSVTGPLSGYTCRELTGYLAALVGCNAVIDREGRLALRWFEDHGQSVTPSEYYAGTLKLDGTQTLTGLRLVKKNLTAQTDSEGITREQEERVIYSAGTGTGTVLEVENPFATQAVTDAVWSKLSALGSFRTGSCSYFAGLDTEPGDLLSVTDREGNTCHFPAVEVRLELDGGCRTSVSSAARTETALTTSGTVGRLLSRLEADLGAFRELTADNFTAAQSRINTLYTDETWVNELFSQHITATRLDVSGASRFTGVIDAAYAEIGDVTIGEIDNLYTRDMSVSFSEDDEEMWVTITEPGAPLSPGERRQLVKIGVWVTNPNATGRTNFNLYLLQDDPYIQVDFDTSCIQYNEEEVFFPVKSNTFQPNKIIEWGGHVFGGMGGSRIHMRMYFGDRGVLAARGNITTQERFIENGAALEDKYAALSHDHDSDYAALSHDHDSDYAALSHDHDSDYAAINHDHDSDYAAINHDHDSDYAALNHDHDSDYAAIGHDHDGDYAAIGHDHDGTYLPLTGGSVSGNLSVSGTVSGSNIPIIQQGNTGRISGVSSVKTTRTVTFSTPFPGAPRILLTPVQNGGYFPSVKLETVSSSGFRLAISIPSGTTNDISVDWLAIYV